MAGRAGTEGKEIQMRLKPIKHNAPKALHKAAADVMSSPGKYLTEGQLAEVLGMSVKQAVIKAAEMNFSRIPVKNTRYYSKKQVQAYLNEII